MIRQFIFSNWEALWTLVETSLPPLKVCICAAYLRTLRCSDIAQRELSCHQSSYCHTKITEVRRTELLFSTQQTWILSKNGSFPPFLNRHVCIFCFKFQNSLSLKKNFFFPFFICVTWDLHLSEYNNFKGSLNLWESGLEFSSTGKLELPFHVEWRLCGFNILFLNHVFETNKL